MNFSFVCVFIVLFAQCTISRCLAKTVEEDEEREATVKKLNYPDSVKEIVKDLIASWNSPLVYLKKRGYISPVAAAFKDSESSELLMNSVKKRQTRTTNEDTGSSGDLNNLFRTLFSGSDKNASDQIKTKLGVAWDMDKLKTTVRNEAQKFYDEYYNRHDMRTDSNTPVAINKQVAQLYPSLVSSPTNDHTEEEEHHKDMSRPMVQRESKFLNGIAKLLTSRDKSRSLSSSVFDAKLGGSSAVPAA